MMTSQQQQFDPSRYPDLKPTKPRNKSLRTCTVCKKPGYMYLLTDKMTGTIVIYYAHYNEPPIGLTMLKGKPIGFRYRRCYRDGKTYNSLEEAIEADQTVQNQVLIPKGKENSQGQNLERSKVSLEVIERKELQKLAQLEDSGRIIECPRPRCHQNGVLNIAKKNQDPEKTTFYVRHEKLDGTWGRDHKVARYNRHYIGRLNLQQLKFVSESQTEKTQEKSKLRREGLDRYIEPEIKAHSTVKRKIHGKKSNPTIECPDCGRLGILRRFGGVRFYVAHGSDPRNRCYIKSSNTDQIAFCREEDRKHREELITRSSK